MVKVVMTVQKLCHTGLPHFKYLYEMGEKTVVLCSSVMGRFQCTINSKYMSLYMWAG